MGLQIWGSGLTFGHGLGFSGRLPVQVACQGHGSEDTIAHCRLVSGDAGRQHLRGELAAFIERPDLSRLRAI